MKKSKIEYLRSDWIWEHFFCWFLPNSVPEINPDTRIKSIKLEIAAYRRKIRDAASKLDLHGFQRHVDKEISRYKKRIMKLQEIETL